METLWQKEIPKVVRQESFDAWWNEKITQKEKDYSRANSPHTIAAVLKATEQFLGENLEWDMPPSWNKLEGEISTLNQELPKVFDLLDSIAQQWWANKVNKYLKDNGFSIELDDSNASEVDVFAASILNMPVEWKNEWEKSSFYLYKKNPDGTYEKGKEVDSVKMKWVNYIYEVSWHDNPIVKLETNNWDVVYITKFDSEPPKWSIWIHSLVTDWNKKIWEDTRKEVWNHGDYNWQVEFPMVNYNRSWDIEELLSASTIDKNWFPIVISEAKYQHILKINEKWALAKAAAAVAATRSLSWPSSININWPFIVWFERNWVIPFSAYISENDMKNPGEFETK